MLSKVVLLSVVLMMIVVPVVTARVANARRGLRLTFLLMVAMNIIYLLAIRYVYPRLQ